MQKEIQIGEMVHLNSGSPDLKVVAIVAAQIEVEWTNESGNQERLTLPAPCFTRVITVNVVQ